MPDIKINPIDPIKPIITYSKEIQISDDNKTITVISTPNEPIPESIVYNYDSLFGILDQEIAAILSWYDKIKSEAIQPILDAQAEYATQNGDVDPDIQNQLKDRLSVFQDFIDFMNGL